MSEPWICPRCGRVNAPWLPCCVCEPKSNMNTNTSEWTPIRDFMVKPVMKDPYTGFDIPLTGDRDDRPSYTVGKWECDTCRFYPPSSCDGKPCTQCNTTNPLTSCYQKGEQNEHTD